MMVLGIFCLVLFLAGCIDAVVAMGSGGDRARRSNSGRSIILAELT